MTTVTADTGGKGDATGTAGPAPMSARHRVLLRLSRRKEAVVAAAFLLLLVFVAIFGTWLMPHDPDVQDLRQVLAWPSGSHWLGADHLGRDVFSRIIAASRVALLASLQAVAVGLVLGVPLGLFIGYRGGWWDRIVMRIAEAIISLPGIVVAISVLAILGPGLTNAMFAIGIAFAMAFLRLTRGTVLAVREELFVDASRVIGTKDRTIMFRHILPNVAAPLIIQTTLAFGAALLAEAGLSFLGLGVQPPKSSWGGMLAQAAPFISRNWFIAIPPGLAIAATVLSCNLLGDAVRDSIGRGIEGGQLRRARAKPGTDAATGSGADAGSAIAAGTPVSDGSAGALTDVSPFDATAFDGTPVAGTAAGGTVASNGAAAILGGARVHAVDPEVGGPSPDVPFTIEPALEVRDLRIAFPSARGEPVTAVSGISFHVDPGETLGLVGESGCGKSVTALSVLGLLPGSAQVTAARVAVGGQDLAELSDAQLRQVRGGTVGMVFQDPMTSLNPALTVGDQLMEAYRLHRPGGRAEAKARARELLGLVRIPDPGRTLAAYPHEMSGGMAQRTMIAMALACEPKLLIADEPTTALDVTVQGQVIDLLRDLQSQMHMAILFITHDLGVVADICDRAAVMYAGELVETAPVAKLFATPTHPYTQGLLRSRPQADSKSGRLPTIPGTVPPPGSWPTGCRFAPRCPFAIEPCVERQHLTPQEATHLVRCVRADEVAVSGAPA